MTPEDRWMNSHFLSLIVSKWYWHIQGVVIINVFSRQLNLDTNSAKPILSKNLNARITSHIYLGLTAISEAQIPRRFETCKRTAPEHLMFVLKKLALP